MKTGFIWMNGRLVPWNEAKIHVLTYALHYGTAAFEGIRCYQTEQGPAIFRLDEHIERLLYSFSAFSKDIPYDHKSIKKAILELIKANALTSCYIRPLLYFGFKELGLTMQDLPINLAIAAWPWQKQLAEGPISVSVSKYRRLDSSTTDIDKKLTGHYVNSMLAHIDVRSWGFSEALLLDCNGFIAEGSGANIFFVKDGILITPSEESILPGITRDSIIQIAQDMGISVEKKAIKYEDLEHMDEAFFTGTATEITPIASIDEYKFAYSPNVVTLKLKKAYKDIITGKNDAYNRWLTYL